MSDDQLCIAVDLGSGGPKIGLVSLTGEVLAQESHAVTTTFGPGGLATQNAREWWDLVRTSVRRLSDAHPGSAQRVAAVTITGQWASTVPVDANGDPTGPCVNWQDTRGGPHVRERIGGRVAGYKAVDVARWIRKTGGAPSKSGGDPVGHILHLLLDEPDQSARTTWFLEPVDFLTMQFCGDATATHASMQGAWLTDVRHMNRMEYDQDLLDAVGIPVAKLPPLRPIGSVIGVVRPDVASELGLSPDVAVVTGLPDLQAAALGARATSLHSTHLALSTTSWISCPVNEKKTDISHSIGTVPGLSNDQYLIVNNQDTGAKALEWLRGILAQNSSPHTFDELTALAATSEPGSHGVLFTPWLGGERSPVDDHAARGGYTNLSLTTTTADMVRAVLEGVAMNSAWLFGYVEKFCGVRIDTVRVVGGGARSDLWCQIMADVLNRTIEQVPDPMFAQLRGIASLSSVALGHATLAELEVQRTVGRVFAPQPAVAERLAVLASELPDIYATSKARFRRLNGRG
jgi:xylulokinase